MGSFKNQYNEAKVKTASGAMLSPMKTLEKNTIKNIVIALNNVKIFKVLDPIEKDPQYKRAVKEKGADRVDKTVAKAERVLDQEYGKMIAAIQNRLSKFMF